MRVVLDAIDPMPALRQAKVDAVNRSFNTVAAESLHRDQAHAQKRLWAATNDQRLAPEAELRGITVVELSAFILSKPDAAAAREMQRQTIMKRIDQARTPAELDAI
ncbi:hypothetical protein SAMN05444159_1252 [Bradyrhizobium lablabi]|uniref:Uncharacterized protein n=1 Tax=Bradyrhizobium lablabi TaxID=722472 RepID=A0A1M6LEH4_9BRAD|nr:hypothetical protein [Bradyrhizobium lablabi]SHJ69495.1 hypothetical protein SAMN05444159_1252 [Bradyrhizobium lablabi]